MTIVIAVLALQGAFIEHCQCFNAIENVTAFQLRTMSDVVEHPNIHGIVFPGGESTTMGNLLGQDLELYNWIKGFIESRKGLVWGTCAGMILLAKKVTNQGPNQLTFKTMDISVDRNYFGRQLYSFRAIINPHISENIEQFPGVFIRAPIVTELLSPDVKVVCEIEHPTPVHPEKKNIIVAVEQNNCLATSFHPEISFDSRWHCWWVETRIKPFFNLP